MDVHLWLMRTDVTDEALARAGAMLGPAERARADAYRFDDDRRRFIVGRAFLRTVLGLHIGAAPAAVRLEEERGEKPRLARGGRGPRVEFNLSRSGDHVLCGVASGRRIGVDIERVRDVRDVASVAAHAMTPGELERWHAGPGAARGDDFLRAWTRKEALVKAGGHRLADALGNLPVPREVPAGRAVPVRGVRPGAPGASGASGASGAPGASWLMSDLGLDESVIGCVVVEGEAAPGGVAYADRLVAIRPASPRRVTCAAPAGPPPWPDATHVIRCFDLCGPSGPGRPV